MFNTTGVNGDLDGSARTRLTRSAQAVDQVFRSSTLRLNRGLTHLLALRDPRSVDHLLDDATSRQSAVLNGRTNYARRL